jgi:hypothetical protein
MWQLSKKSDPSNLSSTDETSNQNYPRSMKDMMSMVTVSTKQSTSSTGVNSSMISSVIKGIDPATTDTTVNSHDMENKQLPGAKSDIVNHVVKLSFPYDSHVQGIELALRWKLGDITNGRKSTTVTFPIEKVPPGGDISSTVGSRLLVPMIPARHEPTDLQQGMFFVLNLLTCVAF